MPLPPVNGYYLTLGLLIACTVVGIGIAARFRREVDHDLAPTTARDLLDPLENAYQSGLMHPEEIERIRESVKKAKLAGAKPSRLFNRPKPTDHEGSIGISEEEPPIGDQSFSGDEAGPGPSEAV